jgi:hypothetical protein
METTTIDETEAVLGRLDEMWAALDGQQLVSQARYVDDLLDCFLATMHAEARELILEALASISGQSAVRTSVVRDHIAIIAAAILLD